ncbi:MAG: putative calnexin [Streblomastix strix]|uniref:Putative calnexin n=1 Tax=Streblomastix strix TaxID=222440 RepID=A0A5J4U8Y0_9EUKA|nr:MAG: putative calnexin [Streblomastix strix]
MHNQWVRHDLKKNPVQKFDGVTHLYTLVITKEDTFKILIDGIVQKEGSLQEEGMFNPPFQPPEKIPDLNEKKPKNWVDQTHIPDPDDIKPSDWDENEPFLIPDYRYTKPDKWDEDALLDIVDTNVKKPDLWDDEKDGEWIQPVIPNPYCEQYGCGKWEQPQKKNPKYKGKYPQRQIKNPEYIGPWEPSLIQNPGFYVPKDLHKLIAVKGLAFDITNGGTVILFDNILISNSTSDAEQVAEKMWRQRYILEQQEEVKRLRKEKLIGKWKYIKEQWVKLRTKPLKENLMSIIQYLADNGYDHPIISIILLIIVDFAIIMPFAYLCLKCYDAKQTDQDKKILPVLFPSKQQKEENKRWQQQHELKIKQNIKLNVYIIVISTMLWSKFDDISLI